MPTCPRGDTLNYISKPLYVAIHTSYNKLWVHLRANKKTLNKT